MPLSKTRFRKGVIIAADADALEGIEGEIKIDSADSKIKTTLNATPHEVVTNDQSQTLSNKTLTSPVINTGVSGTAIDTDVTLAANSDTLLASQKAIKAYVTAVAGAQDAASEITVVPAGTISSTNVQAALQELDTDIQNHLSDATDAHDASAISNVPAGSIAATDVQAAINELDTDIQNHIIDSADAHDASAISNVPSGNLAATDVQAALNELQGDIDTNTSGISNHLSNATDAHDASAISVVPTGNLAASDVQSALNELQGDADASNTHIAASTNVHGVGVGNSVVGTGTSQVLTNKTITGADIRTPVRSDVKQDTKANLTTYALTASNGQLCFATDTKEMFQVVDTLLESVGGGAGIGGVDILFSQTFEEAALTDFTQTGMSLSTSSPIHGAISALMTHQAATSQSFKQIVAVDEKFRGQAMLLELNVKSTASAGNVTLTVRDETNSANIVSSEQLTLSSATGGIKVFSAFTIPVTCLSLSYTITALPEAGSPVTRIDDILCQLNNASLLETSVTVPNITAWQAYTPTFQGFGTPSAVEMEWRQVGEDVEIRGKFLSGSTTAVEARVGLPNGYTSAGTSLIPSIQIMGKAVRDIGTVSTIKQFVILIEPSVTYLTIGRDDYTSAIAPLTKQNGNSIASPGEAFSFFASVPCAGLTATSDVAIPLTQSGIVQEADSVLFAAGNTAQVITAGVTDIPFTPISSVGSDVSFNGSLFTVINNGIYTISGSVAFTAAADQRIALYVDGAIDRHVSIAATASSSARAFSTTIYLTAGQTFSIRSTTTAGTLSNALSQHYMYVTKQGSLKQVSVNTNSKITIPTSELRFEGASTRGSVATAIVKFDTLAKIRGDAFTVTNTANDGTYVTMTKAGKLDVSVSLYKASATQYVYITKNQAVLTAIPANASEILAISGSSSVISNTQYASCSEFVSVGDIIRIVDTQTPTATYENVLSLSFQEQEIQVSVSNTLPQFSESDSSVRLSGAGASPFGSVATTTRRFASVIQNLGTDIEYTDSATLGGQFRAKADGIYNVSYSEISAANASVCAIYIVVNGVEVSYDVARLNTSATLSKGMGTSWQGFLSAGDIVTATNSGAANNDGNSVAFTMSKVGKPNVTGVNVTPFVNVPQPVSQSSEIQQTVTFGNVIITGALTSSTGSSIYSYSSSTGLYTVLKEASFNINASLEASGAAAVVPIVSIDGTARAISSSPATAGARATVSYSGNLKVGQSFSIVNGTANTTNNQRISVLATASADTILTAPETFSTDTAALTYASSAAYTLSTLANAPVGTFITFTYAANTNTRTQTTTAPTQTTADMNANGMLIYTRAFNATSTAAQPATLAIQIGKGLKGKSLDLYKSAGKVTAGSLDNVVTSTTNASGVYYKDYNEVTGILIIDAGVAISTNTSHIFEFTDLTGQTSGYLVINASKNPALTGFGLGRVYLSAADNAGQVITANVTNIPFIRIEDTHGAWNGTQYTVPETGIYSITGHTFGGSNTGNTQLYVNAVDTNTIAANHTTTTHGFAITKKFNKGDVLSFRSTTGFTLTSNAVFNHLEIAKVGF
jgi:hypothetical protein